ncbi:sigma-70 family RNA polymerase sigma factor [soil metagenome]
MMYPRLLMDHSQLIKNCLKGKRLAQQELYNQFAAQMLGVCYRYTKNLDDAEDVLQDGFMKVYNNLQQFKGEGDLGGWIRRIMVNTALTYLRIHTRYRNQMDFEHMPLHPVVEEQATMNLQTAALIEIIRKLPSGYQTIFNLVAIEGYNHIEVAALLNINENTSRSQYSRARAMLIREIEAADQSRSKQQCI